MSTKYMPAILGVAVAIAITTAMDAAGLSMFSALPLFPLAALYWLLQRHSRQEIGLTWGKPYYHGVAIAYPLIVLGTIGIIAFLAGAVDTADADVKKTVLNIFLMSSTGILMGVLTEEGFFRGWLWASLRRAGQTDNGALIWTTLAFTAWHISAITLDTGFDVPAGEVPIYLLNATMLGAVWGLLRLVSGSIVVPSVCHAIWNGIDYPLFGFGEKVGALGIYETHVYGPEVGVVGVGVNLLVVAILFKSLWKTR